jgi:thioredoxin 1
MSDLIKVDDNSFNDEVLASDKPVLVKWTATFCGPCQRQTPILEKFAEQNTDIKVCVAECDDCPNMCSVFKIRSIPVLMLFNKGNCVATKVGLTPLNEVEALIFNNIEDKDDEIKIETE